MGEDCMWVFVGSFWAAVFGFMVFEISFLPKRKWVGLTDEEIHEVASKKWWDWEDAFDIEGFSRAIEATLKEKNG